MTFKVEKSLADFKFRGGAIYTVTHMTSKQIEQVEEFLEIDMIDGGYTPIEINDLFWFEADTIANWLGFESFAALEEYNKREGLIE